MADKKRANPKKLLEKLPSAILEGASIRKVAMSEGMSQKSASLLAHAIQTPIEEFNARLADKLGEAANVYLDILKDRAHEMPLASVGYTLAVLIDKRTALTGRTNPAGTSVNLQINSIGMNMSKEDLLDLLEGKKRPTTAPEAAIPCDPSQPDTQTPAETPTEEGNA